MSRGPDAAALLERALLASAATADVSVRATDWRTTRWAPATFTGTRHELTVTGLSSSALTAWLDGLPDADLPMRRHFVAGIVAESRDDAGGMTIARLAVLTVEEN